MHPFRKSSKDVERRVSAIKQIPRFIMPEGEFLYEERSRVWRTLVTGETPYARPNLFREHVFSTKGT